MSLLLDTHVWLWWNTTPERLSESIRRQISDPATRVCLSAASVWEMAIKAALGRLPLPEPVATYVSRRVALDSIEELPVRAVHAAAVETLERLHSDPFDRLLVVQARYERLALVTVDRQVLTYGGNVVDARPASGPGAEP